MEKALPWETTTLERVDGNFNIASLRYPIKTAPHHERNEREESSMYFHTDLKQLPGGVCAPAGFRASGLHCGIRPNTEKPDLAMILADVPCAAAGVYTQNLMKGAPVLVTKENLADGKAQAVICNSGNANTCNADGLEKARAMCDLTAKALGLSPQDVIVASTGVIGQPLPLEPIAQGIAPLVESLSREGGHAAATAIMTTDTVSKELALEFTVDGIPCRIAGMAKGSGMIHPNMATMLCFLTTDCAITPALLDKALHRCVADTFNMVSVDGDTSTNDTVVLMASGLAKNPEIQGEGAAYEAFCKALFDLLLYLSTQIAGDGEGATKLLVCSVTGAKDKEMAKACAKSVICSPLVKAAMFGADANCGRVLCALGYAGQPIDPHTVDVDFESEAGRIRVCAQGNGLAFDEEAAKAILLQKEILIHVDLGLGEACADAFGCDLTYDYVKINGDYRS